MNRMLTRDLDHFQAVWPNATAFINAAHLRYEAFCLHRKGEHRTEQEEARLEELLTKVPACQEDWFVNMLDLDKIRQCKKVLEEFKSP